MKNDQSCMSKALYTDDEIFSWRVLSAIIKEVIFKYYGALFTRGHTLVLIFFWDRPLTKLCIWLFLFILFFFFGERKKEICVFPFLFSFSLFFHLLLLFFFLFSSFSLFFCFDQAYSINQTTRNPKKKSTFRLLSISVGSLKSRSLTQ